jgi:hypothetical protein
MDFWRLKDHESITPTICCEKNLMLEGNLMEQDGTFHTIK